MAEQTATLVGTLTEEEMNTFNQTRQMANQLIQQLGALELRKARVVAQIDLNERRAQELLASARERVGLDLETPWQIRENGEIYSISEGSEEGGSTEAVAEEPAEG